VEFLDGEADLTFLPYDEELSIVAECYDKDPYAAKAEPRNLISKGQTVPFKRKSGKGAGPVTQETIYLMKPSSFAPTLTFGGGELACSGTQTKTFTERWGATGTDLYDGSILVAGGVDEYDSTCTLWSNPDCAKKASSTAELYNPRDGSFTLVGTDGGSLMSQKRAFAAAVRLPSEEIAIFGGIDANGQPTSTVDIYDPFGMSFKPGLEMSHTRTRHTATLISSIEGGYVLLIGGFGTGEATWDVWNPNYGSIAEGQLHESRWSHTASLLTKKEDSAMKRNMVLIAGGEGGGDPGAATVRETIEIFDIDANALDPAPLGLCSNGVSPTAKKTMHAAAFVPKRHFLYVAGGFKDAKHQDPVRDICVWHSSQEKWSGEAGTFMLRNGRGALTATALPGNVVLFAGGIAKEGVAETVEIVFEYLNEKGETVVDIGPGTEFPIPMWSPRWDHGAVLGADNKVLFFGGLTGSTAAPSMLKDTELFNPQ
jgi:hypothetical protein